MKTRTSTLTIAGLLLGPAILLFGQTGFAQSGDVPRTEHGHPDLQGIYTYRTLTPLNRPAELADREVLT